MKCYTYLNFFKRADATQIIQGYSLTYPTTFWKVLASSFLDLDLYKIFYATQSWGRNPKIHPSKKSFFYFSQVIISKVRHLLRLLLGSFVVLISTTNCKFGSLKVGDFGWNLGYYRNVPQSCYVWKAISLKFL